MTCTLVMYPIVRNYTHSDIASQGIVWGFFLTSCVSVVNNLRSNPGRVSFSMHRRPGVVVLAPVDQMKAPFEACQAALVEIELDAAPGIAAAEIEIAEEHTAQVSQVGDAAFAGGDRGVERDGANDPDEMFHFDGKEKIQVNDLIGIDQTKGEENTVNAGRRSDARPHLIGDEKSVEDSAANRGDKIIFEKELTAPPALQGAAEHPERQHVEEQVEQPAVEKLIGKKLPEVKILPNQVRHQAEQT